jgi:heme oxygenase
VFTTEPTDVAWDIMARLKRETASLHAELDAMVAPMLSERPSYRVLLAGLRDAYGVIERELAKHAMQLVRVAYDPAKRAKLSWLDEDLTALSESAPSAARMGFTLPNCSAAIGAVYVVEGATLGGQVIARMVMPALALSPERGCRFFSGYGAETGERWRETRDAIVAHLASTEGPDAANETIGGARMTFSLIRAALRARIRS